MNYLLPPGIGDSVWGLHKIQSVAERIGDHRIDVILAGDKSNTVATRALDFVSRFDFIDSVSMRLYDIHPSAQRDPCGFYNYISDGLYTFDGEPCCALMPNGPLERGIRLEDWLPQYEINWDIFQRFHLLQKEQRVGGDLRDQGDYAVFYIGPLEGNTRNGHNRGPLWTPADWLALGRRVHSELNLRIIVVGAPYDAPYFDLFISPSLNGDGSYWTNLIGQTSIGELYSITSNARFVISYQSGVGIVSTYLGTPTGIFWRPRGDSISPDSYLSFDERMASGWVPPSIIDSGNHLPLIYTRDTVDDIMAEVTRRGWA